MMGHPLRTRHRKKSARCFDPRGRAARATLIGPQTASDGSAPARALLLQALVGCGAPFGHRILLGLVTVSAHRGPSELLSRELLSRELLSSELLSPTAGSCGESRGRSRPTTAPNDCAQRLGGQQQEIHRKNSTEGATPEDQNAGR